MHNLGSAHLPNASPVTPSSKFTTHFLSSSAVWSGLAYVEDAGLDHLIRENVAGHMDSVARPRMMWVSHAFRHPIRLLRLDNAGGIYTKIFRYLQRNCTKSGCTDGEAVGKTRDQLSPTTCDVDQQAHGHISMLSIAQISLPVPTAG